MKYDAAAAKLYHLPIYVPSPLPCPALFDLSTAATSLLPAKIENNNNNPQNWNDCELRSESS